MKRISLAILAAVALATPALAATPPTSARKAPTKAATAASKSPAAAKSAPAAKPAPAPRHAWSLEATSIEACSCPMLCSRYFVPGAASPTEGGRPFCRFNRAIQVKRGYDHDVVLDGARFWVSGDLGADPAHGGEWAVITFDHSLSEPQRQAIQRIVTKLYPVEFKSLATDEADISWVLGPEEAHALINNGRTGEVALKKGGFATEGKTPTLSDVRYWGAQSHTGFRLMPGAIDAYRVGAAPFEHQGTSGFVVTFEIHGDEPAAGALKAGD